MSKSCLVIKNDGIGDLILSSGILASLSREFDGNLDLVTCEQNREIVKFIPEIRKVYYVSRDGLRFFSPLLSLGHHLPVARGKDLRVLWELSRTEYTVAVSLRRFIRQSTLALMRWCRADRKYCAWQFPTNLTRQAASAAAADWIHYEGSPEPLLESSYYRSFLSSELGIDADDSPRLTIPETSRISLGPDAIGMCIGGRGQSWGGRDWVTLITSLKSEGRTFHLFGGSDSRSREQHILSHHPDCISHIGKLGFEESIPYLQALRAIVANDTGFTHFASLFVPHCLILMGGGTFGRFFPWPRMRNQYLVYHGLDCFDCEWRCKFEQKHCLTKIRPESVKQCFEKMLANKGPRATNLNPEDIEYKVAWKRGPWKDETRRFSDPVARENDSVADR